MSLESSPDLGGVREPAVLTIVCHPDVARVGETLSLDPLDAGRAVALSRLEPGFVLDGTGEEPQPLSDPYVSRVPIVFRPEKQGRIRLDTHDTSTRVDADGERVLVERVFSKTELYEGVVLLLANRVVLVLHRPGPPRLGSRPEDADAAAAGPRPLSERRWEIGRLLYHYLRRELNAIGEGRRLADPGPYAQPWLPAPLVARLSTYDWPGHAVQVKTFVRRLVSESGCALQVSGENQIDRLLNESAVAAGEESDEDTTPFAATVPHRDAADVSQKELVDALQANRWQLGPTALQLGISRPALFMMIDELTSSAKRWSGAG